MVRILIEDRPKVWRGCLRFHYQLVAVRSSQIKQYPHDLHREHFGMYNQGRSYLLWAAFSYIDLVVV